MEAKDKSYKDYPWTELCKNVPNLQSYVFYRSKQVLEPPRAEAAFDRQQEQES